MSKDKKNDSVSAAAEKLPEDAAKALQETAASLQNLAAAAEGEPKAAKTEEPDDDLFDFDDDDPLSATGVSKKSLVIFFLIDTSRSMVGKKIGELNTVMEELIPEIRRVGEADTDVKIAVLTFGTQVRWMYSEPILIEDFEWARLRADGVTNMGEAFR